MANTKFLVKLGDKEWEFDRATLTLQDAFTIKSVTGAGIAPFFTSLGEMDPTAMQALVWFLRRRDGERIAVDAVQFQVFDLELEAVEDPTPDSPTLSGPGTAG